MSLAETHTPPDLVTAIPPKKPLPLLKMMDAVRDSILAAIPEAAYEAPIYELKGAFGSLHVISDPAGVKRVLLDNVANYPKARDDARFLAAAFGDGLLTSEGDKWRRHRRIMAPSFDHRSIVAYAPAMVEATERFIGKWDNLPPDAVVDIAAEMTALTLQLISRTMFSSDADIMAGLVDKALTQGMGEMNFGLLDLIPVLGPWRINRRLEYIRSIFSILDASIQKMIEARAGMPEADAPTDLLARLVAARDVEGGAGMSVQEIRDEVVIIFIAGHETTAGAMTFAWYLLSKHPSVEAKLHAELEAVLGGRAPTYEDLETLPYARQIIQETLRLYPSAPSLSGREAVAEDVIEGHRIPKGDQVAVMPWVIHRHKALWSEPDRFDPDRFSPENSAGRDRFAYLPFGGGPRICIGAALAMTEAQLILATIAQRYRPRYVEDQSLSLKARITLRPRDGLKMTLERR
jgi:cytochrome P450